MGEILIARTGGATVRLTRSLRRLKISPVTVALLNAGESRDVDLLRLVRMDRWTIEREKTLTRTMLVDLQNYLRRRGLALYLTEAEIHAFLREGRVPAISVDSKIDRLPLTTLEHLTLRRLRAESIADIARLHRHTLEEARIPGRVIRGIGAAAAPYGVEYSAAPPPAEPPPAAPDPEAARVTEAIRADAVTTEARRRHGPLIPLGRLGLRPAAILALELANILNLEELKERDRLIDLTAIDGLTPGDVVMIADCLGRYGHVAAWELDLGAMGVPSPVEAVLSRRRGGRPLRTKRDLRRFVESGQFARLADHDPQLLHDVHQLLDAAGCDVELAVARR